MPQPLFDLTGRVALVTGGSKGIGAAMARALAEAGADVIISSRHGDELQAALPTILGGTTARGAWLIADMADRAAVERLAAEAIAAFGRVDILVNNAGINLLAPIERVTDADWDRVLAVNLTGPMALARALVPPMKERRWGRIIQISSIFGRVSRDERDAYSASKAGLIGLSLPMALELAPFGVTVNCLLPGPIETPLTSAMHPDPAARQWFTDRVPMGRWARPEELAGPLLLLASDAGSYITGTCLAVDGGWLAQ
ncbi:MAG TPA: SDR family NAD(P)-dependent oxidoreductase [Isosphaeraceae bacterium]|jgi:NAD(P)-dependent dehydrogenase (short-subunit alcohol dehydrogenase family)|nr:SDR family NAD(P)-dependent oxidoreductase [Isosphaeraceae bacterium]